MTSLSERDCMFESILKMPTSTCNTFCNNNPSNIYCQSRYAKFCAIKLSSACASFCNDNPSNPGCQEVSRNIVACYGSLAIFYEGDNRAGKAYSINYAGQITRLPEIGIPDNKIKSICIGPNVNITVYEDYEYKGESKSFSGGSSGRTITSSDLGKISGKLSSYRLSAPGTPIVTIHSEPFGDDTPDSTIEFRGPASFPKLGTPAYPFPENWASAIRVSPGYSVVLFSKEEYDGDQYVVNGGTQGQTIPNLKDVGWDDRLSSLRVERAGIASLEGNLARFWVDDNFQGGFNVNGRTQPYLSIPSPRNIPDFRDGQSGFPNDWLTSLMVAPNAIVTLYEHPNYSGRTVTFSGGSNGLSIPDLRQYDFNDLMSSAKILGPPIPNLSGQTVSGTIPNCNASNRTTCNNGLDPSVCPNIGGTHPLAIEWDDPNSYKTTKNTGSFLVKCTYDRNQFQKPEDIKTWLNTPWNNKDKTIASYDSIIMPYFCSQTSTNCPPYPNIGATGPTGICSRFVATDGYGEVCRTWVQQARARKTVGNVNAAMDNYCSKFPDNPDCGCLQRVRNPVYKLSKTGVSNTNPGSDACWWKPCQIESLYLITDTYIEGLKHCNIQLCQQVSDIVSQKGGKIENTVFQQAINCNFDQGRPPDGPPLPPPRPPSTPSTPSTTGFSIWPTLLIIGILFFLALVGLGIFLFIRFRRRRQR